MEKIVKDMKLAVADSGAVQLSQKDSTLLLTDGCPFEIAMDGGQLYRWAQLKETKEEKNALVLTYALPGRACTPACARRCALCNGCSVYQE